MVLVQNICYNDRNPWFRSPDWVLRDGSWRSIRGLFLHPGESSCLGKTMRLIFCRGILILTVWGSSDFTGRGSEFYLKPLKYWKFYRNYWSSSLDWAWCGRLRKAIVSAPNSSSFLSVRCPWDPVRPVSPWNNRHLSYIWRVHGRLTGSTDASLDRLPRANCTNGHARCCQWLWSLALIRIVKCCTQIQQKAICFFQW